MGREDRKRESFLPNFLGERLWKTQVKNTQSTQVTTLKPSAIKIKAFIWFSTPLQQHLDNTPGPAEPAATPHLWQDLNRWDETQEPGPLRAGNSLRFTGSPSCR
jgi:hypothetical protein